MTSSSFGCLVSRPQAPSLSWNVIYVGLFSTISASCSSPPLSRREMPDPHVHVKSTMTWRMVQWRHHGPGLPGAAHGSVHGSIEMINKLFGSEKKIEWDERPFELLELIWLTVCVVGVLTSCLHVECAWWMLEFLFSILIVLFFYRPRRGVFHARLKHQFLLHPLNGSFLECSSECSIY